MNNLHESQQRLEKRFMMGNTNYNIIGGKYET